MEGVESDQKIIEKYLKDHCVEEALDEVLNYVVTERPANPFTAIAKAIELKTFPEILDVRFFAMYFQDRNAVKAVLETNIGQFSGQVLYPARPPEEGEEDDSRDYALLEQTVRERLIAMDPRQPAAIDAALKGLPSLLPPECLALSIAACKASARFHNATPYEYIADLVGNKREDITIPLPVLTVANKPILSHASAMQSVSVYPVKYSDIELCVDKLREVGRAVSKGKKSKGVYDTHGGVCMEGVNVEEIAVSINEVLAELSLSSYFKVGVHYSSSNTLKPLENDTFVSAYALDGAVKSGQEVVDKCLGVWQDVDMVVADDILDVRDAAALRYLKKRVNEIVYELKQAGSEKLPYCLKGIGQDPACHLQIPAACTLYDTIPDVERQLIELPFNSIKISWGSVTTISDMVEFVKKAKRTQLPVILNCLNSVDDLDVSFGVGVGASQLVFGGLFSSHTTDRLNTLLDLKRTRAGLGFIGKHFRAPS